MIPSGVTRGTHEQLAGYARAYLRDMGRSEETAQLVNAILRDGSFLESVYEALIRLTEELADHVEKKEVTHNG